jgi:ubiquinone/menaquinone biosynthesis C-methylase UbiE
MTKQVHHPLFARMYRRVADAAEGKGASEHRDELLVGLSGRVVEVGAGTGLNFAHYPKTVSEVVAVEPEPYLRTVAEAKAGEVATKVTVVNGTADDLPAAAGEFDAGVASLVLCSVPSQTTALSELFRVIRPGGELRFYEHVVSDEPRKARMQNAATRFWPRVGGGCHPNRDTVGAIERAGFEIDDCERFEFRPSVLMAAVAPHVIGTATMP